MATMSQQELSTPSCKKASPEEIARVRAIMAEKECHVVVILGGPPLCYKGRALGDSQAKTISVADLITSI